MKKFKIGLVGMGAIGAWIYSYLRKLEQVELFVLADDSRLQKLQEGVTVNGQSHHLPVYSYQTPAGNELDFLFLATKMTALADVLEKIEPWVGEKTQIVPLQNGLTSEEETATKYGWDRVIHAISLVAATREGQEIVFEEGDRITIGETQTSALRPDRIEQLNDLLTDAGMKVKIAEEITRDLWIKFLSNCTNNQYLAILNQPYTALGRSPELRELIYDLGMEIILLAKAEHINLSEEDVNDMVERFAKYDVDGYPSTAQDLRANRKTEVETFAGECIRLGKKHAIPTPHSLTIYRMIKTIEEMQ